MALHQPFGKDFDHPSASPDRPEVSVKFRPTQARYVFDAAEPNSLDILPKTEAQELAADTLAAEGFWPDSLPPRPGPGRFPTTAHRGRRTAFPRRSCHVHPLFGRSPSIWGSASSFHGPVRCSAEGSSEHGCPLHAPAAVTRNPRGRRTYVATGRRYPPAPNKKAPATGAGA